MSWLPKQALWKVQIVSPNEIDKHFHKVTKHNKQHQFDLFQVPHNAGSYTYILTGTSLHYDRREPGHVR